jgi:integrase
MKLRLNKSAIDKLKPKVSDYFVWDTLMPNFGLRVHESGRKVYVIQYRKGPNTRRYKIGVHGHLTVQQARKEAHAKLGEVATGGDPSLQRQRENRRPTMSRLCDEYLEYGCGHKKPSTIASDKYRIERHIRPLLGQRRVDTITRADVTRFMKLVSTGHTPTAVKSKARGRPVFKGGKGTANRTVGLLGGIFTFAVTQGYCATNPVNGVKKHKEGKRERFLSPEEYGRLGKAIAEFEQSGRSPLAVQAVRLLAITGCRAGEITNLRWENVDWENGYLKLPDTKTGYRNIPLSDEAKDLLAEISDQTGSESWVFPNSVGGPLRDIRKTWLELIELAGLKDVRVHDLRHSYASAAISAGVSLFEVGKILGHRCQETTARYAHLTDDAIAKAAGLTSQSIVRAIGNGEPL